MLGFVDGFVVEVGEVEATIAALDDSGDSFDVARVIRVDGDEDSANIRHELIGGGIAMALAETKPQSGTLELLFDSDAAAVTARGILARATTFALSIPSRPSLAMTFARYGNLSPTMHLELEGVWMVKVGFQEV